LRVELDAVGITPDLITVDSCGVDTVAGLPMCKLADTLAAEALGVTGPHRSTNLTKDIAESVDLILTADRGHRSAIGRLAPRTRSRTFTLRQASRLAAWVVSDSGSLDIAVDRARGIEPTGLDDHDPRLGVPALPKNAPDRLLWFITELDAARGTSPVEVGAVSTLTWHPDDIADPHVDGWQLHDPAVSTALASTRDIVQAFRTIVAIP
jgi:protein-tyrosine-phosphatase